MKKGLYLVATVILLLALSCMRQDFVGMIDRNVPDGQLMTFKASMGDLTETKTAFQSSDAAQWPVYWTPGDAINIFYGSRSEARFQTVETFTQAGPIAEFEGYLQAATGSSDGNGNVTTQNFWAVYPYDANNTCDGNSVTLTIPSAQSGVAGTFANNLNPTVACSPNLGLSFYNVASWFIFTLTQENVVSATLTGVNGETLVGKVKVSIDGNGLPVIDQVTDGETSITMVPEGGSFQVGEYYCMVILPQTFEDGIKLTLTKNDGAKAECIIAPKDGSPMTVARSKWARKKNADADLTYLKEGNIAFADNAVKAICVDPTLGWDTNGDGELSYIEAAAVSAATGMFPYSVFSYNTTITSFDEFQYFTGVTKLGYTTDGRYDEGYDYIGAFSGCTSLQSIVFPPSLTDIGIEAFSFCTSLESITIPATVEQIGMSAFSGCTNLVVTMESESPCTLYADAYESCGAGVTNAFGGYQTRVKAILVPTDESVTAYQSAQYWSDYAFLIHKVGWVSPSSLITFKDAIVELYCVDQWDTNGDGRLSMTEAAAVTDIGTTFKGVDITSFDELKYFTGISTIPAEAFSGCSLLESLSFPPQITSIGTNAFSGASKLKKVNVPSLDLWMDVVCSAKPFSGDGDLYINDVLVTEISIPSGRTRVSDYFAYHLSHVETVNIPNSVTHIGTYAFYGCKGLTAIGVPSGVTWIGPYAFSECTGLTTIDIPSGVQAIAEGTFRGCAGLTTIEIPSNMSYFGQYAFSDCTSLSSIVIPDGVYAIYGSAFRNCIGLSMVTIPESVTTIGKNAFEGCSGLSSITIPGSVETIDRYTFSKCGDISVIISEGVKNIEYAAFNECRIVSIYLPSTISSLKTPGLRFGGADHMTYETYGGAFYGAVITSLIVPNNIIGTVNTEYLFNGVANYNSHVSGSLEKLIVIKTEGATSYTLPNEAFSKLNFSSIELDSGLKEIPRGAFNGVKRITHIDIPESVRIIWDDAFSGCSYLESITIPANVMHIGKSVFSSGRITSMHVSAENSYYDSRDNCNAIIETSSNTLIYGCQNTVIPEDVTDIGDFAFYSCSGLTSIALPDRLISIGTSAFYGCRFASIDIPVGVTSIGDSAFASCISLRSATVRPVMPPIGGFNMFSNTPVQIYVPAESVDAYKTAENWSTYASRIQAMPAN